MTIKIELTGKQFGELLEAIDVAIVSVEDYLDTEEVESEADNRIGAEKDLVKFKELKRELTGK
jgi:hypothetical protein